MVGAPIAPSPPSNTADNAKAKTEASRSSDKTGVSEERCGCDELGQTREEGKVEVVEDGAARPIILTATCKICQEVQRTS